MYVSLFPRLSELPERVRRLDLYNKAANTRMIITTAAAPIPIPAFAPEDNEFAFELCELVAPELVGCAAGLVAMAANVVEVAGLVGDVEARIE